MYDVYCVLYVHRMYIQYVHPVYDVYCVLYVHRMYIQYAISL